MKKEKEDISPEEATMNKQAIWVLIFGVLLMIILPFLFTRSWSLLVLTETGNIGDSIGGMTAPAIGLMSAALIFLSFKAQIRMNERQWNEIKKQQNIKSNDFALEMVKEITSQFKERMDVFTKLEGGQRLALDIITIQSLDIVAIEDLFKNKDGYSSFCDFYIRLSPFIEIVDLHEKNQLNRYTYVKIGYLLLKNKVVIDEILEVLERFKFDEYVFDKRTIETNKYIRDIKKMFDKIYSIRVFMNDLNSMMMKSIE
jgi:hypothetical protein